MQYLKSHLEDVVGYKNILNKHAFLKSVMHIERSVRSTVKLARTRQYDINNQPRKIRDDSEHTHHMTNLNSKSRAN